MKSAKWRWVNYKSLMACPWQNFQTRKEIKGHQLLSDGELESRILINEFLLLLTIFPNWLATFSLYSLDNLTSISKHEISNKKKAKSAWTTTDIWRPQLPFGIWSDSRIPHSSCYFPKFHSIESHILRKRIPFESSHL